MVTLLPLVLMIITWHTSEALISVHPPVITRQPGQTLSIECNSSSPNATVQWTLPHNGSNFIDRLLVMESVTINDSGVYECSVDGESATADVFIFTGSIGVFVSSSIQSGVQFITLPPDSIMTSVLSSHQFICVSTSSETPQWYYKKTILPTNTTGNTSSSFTNLYKTGNYTCSVNTIGTYTVTLATERYYIEVLNDNITGTLGGKICAYWRAGLSYLVNDIWHQYSTQLVAENTVVLFMDEFVGESSLENVKIFTVSSYLFSYCEEHAENENYKIMFANDMDQLIGGPAKYFTFTVEVPTLSTKGPTSLHYGEGGGSIIMTCYSDLPLNSIVWWYNDYNQTLSDICKFDNSCTYDSPFANSTYNTSSNGTIHQLILALDDALHGIYSCGIYPVFGSAAVHLQNFTFYECPLDVHYGLLWKPALGNSTINIPCSEIHASFRKRLYITRRCSMDGTWMDANLSSCTVHPDFGSLLILSFLCSAITEGANIEMKVEEMLNRLQLPFKSINTDIYPYDSAVITTVKSFPSINYTIDTISVLHSTITESSSIAGCHITDNSVHSALYVSSDVCYCHSMEDNNTVFHQFCIGPSLPACVCVTTDSCECSDPFVGDGRQCTTDSDGDGFGDNELDCELHVCRKDNCPHIFNRNQSSQDCDGSVPLNGCPLETDPYWNITWRPTSAGMMDTQKCPGGASATGYATRLCTVNEKWSEQVDVTDCERVEFVQLYNRGRELEGSNESSPENIETLNEVITELAEITDDDSSLLPKELNTTLQLLETTITYASILNTTQRSDCLSNVFVRFMKLDESSSPNSKVLEIANNLLDVSNVPGYAVLNDYNAVNSTLHNISSLLNSMENYGLLLESTVISKPNIMLSVRDLNLNTSNSITSDRFILSLQNTTKNVPSVATTAVIEMPREALLAKNNESHTIRVVSIVYNDLEEFLPKTPQQKSGIKELGTYVVAVRVSGHATFSKHVPVSLLFKLLPNTTVHGNIDCVFWDSKNSTWSSQGLTYVRHNDSHVECSSAHLTAFSVLVDVHGTPVKESRSLSYVTLIGCAVSLFCLVIAMFTILVFRKVLLVDLLGQTHVNICVALFCGLVTFLSGIETATKYEIACVLVASLLHYFFLAMFCWMLCEGVILYSLTSGVELKKKWFMFYLFGWGTPWLIVIPAVAIKQYNYTEENLCWLSQSHNTIWAFVGPVAVIICVNTLLLIVILIKVYHSLMFANKNGRASKEDNKRLHVIKVMTRNILLLLPVMGCTWLFGLLSINKVSPVFTWIFCILNSLQGLLILILHIIANPKLQDHVKAKFEHRRRIKAVTDSFKSSCSDKRYCSENTATAIARNGNPSRYKTAGEH